MAIEFLIFLPNFDLVPILDDTNFGPIKHVVIFGETFIFTLQFRSLCSCWTCTSCICTQGSPTIDWLLFWLDVFMQLVHILHVVNQAFHDPFCQFPTAPLALLLTVETVICIAFTWILVVLKQNCWSSSSRIQPWLRCYFNHWILVELNYSWQLCTPFWLCCVP